MLSGVKLVGRDEAERLDKSANKKKKHDKKRKKKKEKHSKHSRRDHSSDDDSGPGSSDDGGHRALKNSDSDSGPEDAWQRDIEAQEAVGKEPSIQRDDWMSMPMTRPIDTSNHPPSPKNKDQEKDDPDKIKLHSRELNPYLKDGGSWLPPGEEEDKEASQQQQQKPIQKPPPGIGDGGASWRMKALRRAQEQAKEEGVALKELVAERWGSLGELTAGVTDTTRPAHTMAHAHAARDRKGSHHHSDDREKRDGHRHHHSDRHRDSSRHHHQHDRHRHDHRDRDYNKDGDRGRDRDDEGEDNKQQQRYLSDVRTDKSKMKRPQAPESLSWRRKKAEPPSDSDAHTTTTSHRDRRQPSQQQRRGSDVLGHKDDAELLRSAAPEMNAFQNDGSFMQQFMQQDDGLNKQENTKEEDVPQRTSPCSSSEEEREDRRRPPPRQQQQMRQTSSSIREPAEKPAAGNISAAAMLKARLLGKPPPPAATEETVILPLVDASGRAVPGAFGREAAGKKEAAVKGGKKVERYEGGEKKRYFADDDAVDLDTLVKRAKYGEDGMDIDRALAGGIARKSNFKENDLDADNEYDHDAGIDMLDKRLKKKSGTDQAAEREKQKQIREYQKYTNAVDRCQKCFTSKSRPRHLTIAIGESTYLAIPPRGRLVPGHCQIIPAEHVASTRRVDENVWTEIRNFKKCLIQMFMKQGMTCVFLETAMGLDNMRNHAVIDCIPIPHQAAAKAPMYFKNAIDDATSEWSQHHAKRLIDTKNKGLRGSIPPNFPYLNVEFGISDGFVHVIDNETKFDPSMARSVIIGLLKLPAEDMHRTAKKESEVLQSKWAAEFREQFDEFDWTKML